MSQYKIQFCENNFNQGLEEVIERIKDEVMDVDVEVEVQSCLGFCNDCSALPFALVDGEFIQSETPEDLFDDIVSFIK